MNTLPNISINKEKTSSYWGVSFIGADGKQKRRSTKVPVAGGLFEGENLTKAQAEKRALIVSAQIACRETQNYTSLDNTTVNDFLTRYLLSTLHRVFSLGGILFGTLRRRTCRLCAVLCRLRITLCTRRHSRRHARHAPSQQQRCPYFIRHHHPQHSAGMCARLRHRQQSRGG